MRGPSRGPGLVYRGRRGGGHRLVCRGARGHRAIGAHCLCGRRGDGRPCRARLVYRPCRTRRADRPGPGRRRQSDLASSTSGRSSFLVCAGGSVAGSVSASVCGRWCLGGRLYVRASAALRPQRERCGQGVVRAKALWVEGEVEVEVEREVNCLQRQPRPKLREAMTLASRRTAGLNRAPSSTPLRVSARELYCAAVHYHAHMAAIVAALQRLSSPPVQTLRTLQPTQATVAYTVSTRPEAKTVTAQLSFYTGVALRILVGIAVALLAWAKWCASRENPAVALSWTLGDARSEHLVQLVSLLPWRYLVPASLCTVYLALRRGYTGTLLPTLLSMAAADSSS